VPPIAESEKFITALLTLCLQEQIRLIIPSTEWELELLARNRSLFMTHKIEVAVSDAAFINKVCDKRILHSFLIESGLPTLPLLNPHDKAMPFPIFGKPPRGWGSKGCIKAYDFPDLTGITIEEYVWMPLLENFEEYSVDFAINSLGEISTWVIRNRIRSFCGLCSIGELTNDPVIDRLTSQSVNIFQKHGGRGIFNIQFLKTPDGYFLSDVNPRIGTSSVFSLGFGINLPLFLCASLHDKIKQQHADVIPPKNSYHTMIRNLDETWRENIYFNDFKAVIFDLDDTLCDQKQWIWNKLKILHTECQHFLPDAQTFLISAMRTIEEGNRSHPFNALASEFELNTTKIQEMIECYRTIRPQGTIYPDVLPTLYELKKRGYRLALLTDNPPESQRQKIDACDLNSWFDAIIFSREIGKEKPSPLAFHAVATALNLPTQQLAMIGDNLYRDILGAMESGYGGAFFLRRSGGLLNNDPKIFSELVGKKNTWIQLSSLSDTLTYLPGNTKPDIL
jgi:HAD superfamily hydrolase (TIGR01549 family)